MDRIRENFRKQRKMPVEQIIDLSITQNISRTIITHGSTQMMVMSMFFFGGPTLHNFSLALTFGIWFGIYSSVFVAAAIAMWLGEIGRASCWERVCQSCYIWWADVRLKKKQLLQI